MHIYHRHAPRPATPARPVIHDSGSVRPVDARPVVSSRPSVIRARGGSGSGSGSGSVGGVAAINTPADYLSSSPSEAGIGAFRILIPITVVGWVLVGASCILCINGKGRAGRWVPKWYLDSEGTGQDQAAVVAWWLAVLLLWPVILPVLLARKLARQVGKAVGKMQRRRRQGDEESHTTDEGVTK